MIWYSLSRMVRYSQFSDKTDEQFMILNGQMIGKWTYMFGPNCLADTSDCIGIMKFQKELHPEAEIKKWQIEEKGKTHDDS